MAHVWIVEIRIRPTQMSGRMGPWTQWSPMDTMRGDYHSVPHAFHGKKPAEWECRECRKQALPRKHVEYRATRYDR